MSERWVDEPVPCRDPECRQEQPSAQPESDGSLRYYACPCGFEFGYQMDSQAEGACQLGVPEEIRRIASREPVQASSQQAGRPVFLGASIGRRPG